MAADLRELVDVPALQDLTDELYVATGIPSAIITMDDEPLVAKATGRLLTQLGYSVTTFTSSAAAWAELEAGSHRFDLLITDQTMPEVTGTDLLGRLRDRGDPLPTLICTGYSEGLDPARAVRLGADALLAKPIPPDVLAAAVRAALDRHRPGAP